MNRQSRKQMAEETLRIVESGEYVTHTGSRVVFKDRVTASIQGTRVFTPETLTTLIKGTSFLATETTFDVRNETSLSAARRLVGDHGGGEVFCLNFASAKNPGGGFLGGSEAQEESLARSSTLYATLQSTPSYYDVNRACGTALYTDHMILSPDVTVFRDDDGVLLDEPYEVTFITAPAVNAGAVSRNEPGRKEQIVPVMRRRVAMVLALAANHGCSHLVLGAWGCGVFRNDPSEIASLFAKCLLESGQFADCFETVNFAVLDRPGGIIIEPFLKHFFPTQSHA